MPEVSQSLRFQWLVSAHRAFRYAGREVTHLNLVFLRSAGVDRGVAMGSGNAGYSYIVRSATNSANDVSDLNLSVLGTSVLFYDGDPRSLRINIEVNGPCHLAMSLLWSMQGFSLIVIITERSYHQANGLSN